MLTVEFLKDGSFTGSAGPMPISGTFTTPDERHVKLEGPGLVGTLIGPQVYDARIEKERLILSAGTLSQEFERVPN